MELGKFNKIEDIREIDRLIRVKELRYEELLDTIKAIDTAFTKVQSSGYKGLDVLIARRERTEEEIESLINKRLELIEKIEEIQNTNLSIFLFKRYVERKSFKKIAREMNLSTSYLYKLNKIYERMNI